MAASIVGPNHDDGRLGLEVFQLMAVGDAPEDVPGLVAADAEVDRFEGAEVFLPGFLTFPAVRDGVAQEDDVARALALLDPFEEILVPRNVAVELLDGRVVLVVRAEDGPGQTQCPAAPGGAEAEK